MKNLLASVFVMVVMVITTDQASATDFPFKVEVANENSIVLLLGKIPGKVSISFKDASGNTIYSKKVTDMDSYKVKYKLDEFPDGDYRLVLDAQNQVFNIPVAVAEGIVTLKDEVTVPPVFTDHGDVVAVSFAGKKNSQWNILIQDGEGEVVFTESLTTDAVARRKYDISNLRKGSYVFRFVSSGSNFTHYVKKD